MGQTQDDFATLLGGEVESKNSVEEVFLGFAALELMLTLPGQVLNFCSKPMVAKYHSRVDVTADFRNLLFAQVIGEQFSLGQLTRLTSLS